MKDISHDMTVGVDLGGTSIRIGLYDNTMRLLGSRVFPTRVSAGPDACMKEIASCIDSLIQSLVAVNHEASILGVGIGSPGPINLRTGVLGLLPNLPGWDNFPLREVLRGYTGLNVVLESDANAAAIAEWKFGAGRESGLASMAMITLGTGVGSGLILSGEVWHGMFGMGGEVGHATVNAEGPACGCGSRGCLEMYASSNGLLRLARAVAETSAGTPMLRAATAQEDLSTLRLAELADRHRDSGAILAFAQFGRYLGLGVANLINTLDLPLIVIGGGVAGSWPLFAPAMFDTVRQYSVVYRLAAPSQIQTNEVDRTFICPAVLGPSAGLLGAALLPRMATSRASGFRPSRDGMAAFSSTLD